MTRYVEEEILLSAMDNDEAEVERLVTTMSRNERTGLADACEVIDRIIGVVNSREAGL